MRCDALQQMSKITLACFGIFIPFESRTAYLPSISIEVEEKICTNVSNDHHNIFHLEYKTFSTNPFAELHR